ncbi:hypothetical protein [Rhodococcus sp. MALMAid1271]|uniref:hypothetical protein n=1 Tax=Rhodococcus sp. MALMAid1271 TaxID=3411744 RepID=UPI003BA35F93
MTDFTCNPDELYSGAARLAAMAADHDDFMEHAGVTVEGALANGLVGSSGAATTDFLTRMQSWTNSVSVQISRHSTSIADAARSYEQQEMDSASTVMRASIVSNRE